MSRGFVANTNFDWYSYLAQRGRWDEVNFWNPSDHYAFRGEPGCPFFFRLKAPRNAIGGFGYFSRFFRLPEWLAWDTFHEANGAPSLQALTSALRTIRIKNKIEERGELQQIGCIVLANVVFFPESLWVRQPADWGAQNLRYKGYDLSQGEGQRIWLECLERAPGWPEYVQDSPEPRFGSPVLVAPRLGQGTFRLAVTEAYQRACAVTGEHSLPALEASHIRPFSQRGPHEISNGLLLRSDFHRLFDRGYVTVAADYRIEVSQQLKNHFQNGKTYYPHHGSVLQLPKKKAEWPSQQLLEWHRECVYLG